MADYITKQEFRARHNITATTDEETFAAIIGEASRMIDGLCGRTFQTDTAATARVYHPVSPYQVWIDDAWSITSVATDTGDDGTYATTWAAGDYELHPLNGVGINRVTGWPYTQIVAIESRTFPASRRASVQVTAKWGWATIPDDIKGAAFLLANRLFEERNAPFGTVGSADFGAMPIRDQRTVNRMLAPYMRREPVIA